MRLILASASPARLQTLQAAGVDVSVHVSGVDESSVTEGEPVALASALARLKGEAVLAERGTASAGRSPARGAHERDLLDARATRWRRADTGK